jgi:Zn-dependent protease with chaperone function/Zn-finger nucleic acid-binding protein
MDRKRTRDFYEIQKRQWQRSLALLGVLILAYFLAIGVIALAVFLSIGMLSMPKFLSGPFLMKLLLWVLGVAFFIAVFHYYDARKFGAAYILKRLEAREPDLSDRYHKQLADTVEEMRIAAGLPKVRPYVVPSFAINSMALVEADGTPAVAVTEGLLADCTRDEMQAVAAHELAHVSRGDAIYVTLVCSLVNFLDKLRAAMEPEDVPAEDRIESGRGGAPPVLVYGAVTMTSLIMHLLSMLLSREREILADAAASEIGRNPATLARALYKAHLRSSFVGDFSLTYSPLFIVAPALSSDDEEGFWSRLFNSHPPLMKRIKLLAQQANLRPGQVIEQVRESRRMREEAKGLLYSFKATPVSADKVAGAAAAPDEQKVWLVQDARGKWQNHCPRCRTLLTETFYEGVVVQACGRCGGKLIASSHVPRIILRREVAFSDDLLAKAREFRQQSLLNPVKKQRARDRAAPGLLCPSCGQSMLARPYNYQYFVPVDKCLACYKIWFDADELELLQILVEKKA